MVIRHDLLSRGLLGGRTTNLEEVAERRPLVWRAVLFPAQHRSLNRAFCDPHLEFTRIPFGDRTRVSAKAPTLVETHLL